MHIKLHNQMEHNTRISAILQTYLKDSICRNVSATLEPYNLEPYSYIKTFQLTILTLCCAEDKIANPILNNHPNLNGINF